MTLLTIILTAITLRPVDSCWTFDGRPMCKQQLDAWTCCDAVECFTFEGEPICESSGETFVCCG
jgi:hypothetical protein